MADVFENPMGLDGFEFVEFAAPDPSALVNVFTCLGFQAVAKHRSKNVTLYRQGGINFILNEEPGSPAAFFAEEHGAPFPNLLGEGEDVAEFFFQQTGQALRGTPTFLLYAPGGKLKAVQAGPVPPEGVEAFIKSQEEVSG